MLTKDDLKQIGEVVDEKMKKHFKKELKPIKNHFHTINTNIEIILHLIRHDYSQIQIHDKRITRVETHLDLPSISV